MEKNEEFRYQLKLSKCQELKFLSHLDWQNLILKTLRRAGVQFALSEGFNKVPKVSFSPALPLFIESDCELFNFIATAPLPFDFKEKFKASTSKNLVLREVRELVNDGRRMPSLDNLVQWASYVASIPQNNVVNKMLGISNFEKLRYNIEKCLSSNELFIEKKTKKGILKQINYRKSVKYAEIKDGNFYFTLKTGQSDELPAFRADEFLKYLSLEFNCEVIFEIRRLAFYDKDFKVI